MCSQNLAIEPCPEPVESIPMLSISRQVFCHVSRSISTKCEPCLDAAGRHFEAFVWNKGSWTAGGSRTLNSLRMRAFCSGIVNPGEQGHDAKYSAYSAVVSLPKYNLIFMKFCIVRINPNLSCVWSHIDCQSFGERLFITNVPTTYGTSCHLTLLPKN